MKWSYRLSVLLSLLLFACKGQYCHMELDSGLVVNKHKEAETVLWYKYTQPVNDYDVSIRARFVEYDCALTIFLSRGDINHIIELQGAYDSFHQDSIVCDTIYIESPSYRPDSVKLDYRTTVSFADVNFDGEKDLVICGFPHPNRQIGEPLDCEDFYIYEISNDGLVQVHNMLFDELANGQCRTEYIFNDTQKTITKIAYHSAGIMSKEVYGFLNREPYKVDFTYIADEKQSKFHFSLPNDTLRFQHTVDSIMGYIE